MRTVEFFLDALAAWAGGMRCAVGRFCKLLLIVDVGYVRVWQSEQAGGNEYTFMDNIAFINDYYGNEGNMGINRMLIVL